MAYGFAMTTPHIFFRSNYCEPTSFSYRQRSSGYDAGRASGRHRRAGLLPHPARLSPRDAHQRTAGSALSRSGSTGRPGQCAAVEERFSTIHPLRFDEREAIERWSQVRAGWKAAAKTDALFISRRGTPLSRQQAYRIIRAAGEKAGTVTQTHPICCVTPAATNWRKEGQIPV